MKNEISPLVAKAAPSQNDTTNSGLTAFAFSLRYSVYDPVRNRIHKLRSKQERVYLQSILGDEGSLCITGPIGTYSQALAENWACTFHPNLDSLGKTMMVVPTLRPPRRSRPSSGMAIHIDKKTKLIAFYLNAERPDLSLRLAKALSQQSTFEFNLSQNWFQPPVTDTWIRSAAVIPLIESLGREAWLIVRRREAVFGQSKI